MDLAAVVLSGGISKRFGGDKLKAKIGGRHVLGRVFEALSKVSPRLYLSVADETRGRDLLRILEHDVNLITDKHGLGPTGPALAVCSSILSLNNNYILFTSGDTPWLDPEGLRRFIKFCLESGCSVGSPYWSNGMVETLVQFHVRSDLSRFISDLVKMRRDSMRPSDVLRAAPETLYVHASSISKDPFCFSNINTREDLANPKPRGDVSMIGENLMVEDNPQRLFWRAARLKAQAKFGPAGSTFEAESGVYEKHGLLHIATHSLSDSISCLEAEGKDSRRLKQRLEHLKASVPILPRS